MVVFRNRGRLPNSLLHCRSTVPRITFTWWFPGRQPQRPAASQKNQVIQRFRKRLKWRRQINVEEAKLTESSLALATEEVFPIGVAGIEGFFPGPRQWVGAFFWKKNVFWGLTLFFLYGNFQPKNDYSFRISTSEFQILEFSSAWVEGAGFVGLTLSVRKRNNWVN